MTAEKKPRCPQQFTVRSDESSPRGTNLRTGVQEGAHVSCDLERLREKTLYDPSFLADLLRIFCEDLPGHLNRLREAVRRRKNEEVSRSIHAFLGALRILEATEAPQLASRLQERAEAGDFDGAEQVLGTLEAESERLVTFLGHASPP